MAYNKSKVVTPTKPAAEYKLENVQCIKKLEKLTIQRDKINIKYGFNGLGKSSIGKGLEAFINNEDSKKRALIPFGTKDTPLVECINGTKPFEKCYIFNQEFVTNSLFLKSEVSKDTPTIFIFTDEVNRYIDDIKTLAVNITDYLKREDNPLNIYIGFEDYTASFIGDDHGEFKGRTDLKTGIEFGANIKDFTPSYIFDTFSYFMEMDDHARWYKWRQEANPEWVQGGQCPYCGGKLKDSDVEKIDEINKGFDFEAGTKPNSDKYVEAINIINTMREYAKCDEDREVFDTFLDSGNLGSRELISKIYNVNEYAQNEIKKINSLKSLTSLFTENKIEIASLDNKIKDLKLDENCYSQFTKKGVEPSSFVKAAQVVNNLIDALLARFPDFKEAVSKISEQIDKNIKESKNKINTFLSLSGIPYEFDIELNKNKYSSKLKPKSDAKNSLSPNEIKEHLSYGEYNSLSMALFATMYKSKDEDSLIILDDPISSFDNNKKYAVLHFLFNAKDGLLKDKTVLMLTHDQEPVVSLFLKPTLAEVKSTNVDASFLSKGFDNIIKENPINKRDFVSAYSYENSCIKDTSKSMYLRLFHLKRSFEIFKEEDNNDMYKFVASALKFYKRPCKSKDNKDLMDKDVAKNIEKEIQIKVPGFTTYDEFVKEFSNLDTFCDLYEKTTDKTEKIAVLRTLLNYVNYLIENKPFEQFIIDDILMNFFHETYHSENDNLFMLKGYSDIPPYIIAGANDAYQNIKVFIKKNGIK